MLDFLFKPFEVMMNWDSNRKTNQTNLALGQDNLALGRETNKQNLELQHEAWRREDQAVQRRAADLRAAGISPLLAAGQSATSMAPVKLERPQNTGHRIPHHFDLSGVGEAMLRMRDDFATSRAQRELIRAQTNATNAQAEATRISAGYAQDSWDVRLSQLESSVRLQGEQTTMLRLQQEHQQLMNKFAPDANHGVVLDNLRKEIENSVRERQLHNQISQQQMDLLSVDLANQLLEHQIDIYRRLGISGTGDWRRSAMEMVTDQSNQETAKSWIERGIDRLIKVGEDWARSRQPGVMRGSGTMHQHDPHYGTSRHGY